LKNANISANHNYHDNNLDLPLSQCPTCYQLIAQNNNTKEY